MTGGCDLITKKKNSHGLCDGILYRFGNINRASDGGTTKSILENSIFRFEGFQFGLFTFREIKGNWTVSLSSNQLIGKNIKEVNLP